MKDVRGDRTVSSLMALSDVPTEYCDCHVMVEICGESDHVINEFCPQIEENDIYEVGMLNTYRSFPVSGIVVLDQAYVYHGREIPGGFFSASATEVDHIGLPCYIHSEEDLPKEEEEEGEEGEEGSELDSDFDIFPDENDRASDFRFPG